MTVSFPLLEVSAVGARAMCVSAAAVLAAAVAVYALAQSRERRLRREAVSQRLMAGCTARDVVVLRSELEAFRQRLGREVAQPAGASPGVAADGVLAAAPTPINPSSEGGQR